MNVGKAISPNIVGREGNGRKDKREEQLGTGRVGER